MIKEIKVVEVNNGVATEKSYLTEDVQFKTKKQKGTIMIGFAESGKLRNTWIKVLPNVWSVEVYEATTGRKMKTLYSKK